MAACTTCCAACPATTCEICCDIALSSAGKLLPVSLHVRMLGCPALPKPVNCCCHLCGINFRLKTLGCRCYWPSQWCPSGQLAQEDRHPRTSKFLRDQTPAMELMSGASGLEGSRCRSCITATCMQCVPSSGHAIVTAAASTRAGSKIRSFPVFSASHTRLVR